MTKISKDPSKILGKLECVYRSRGQRQPKCSNYKWISQNQGGWIWLHGEHRKKCFPWKGWNNTSLYEVRRNRVWMGTIKVFGDKGKNRWGFFPL